MIDSVLKGTGNSRFLKSAVPAGTSWADALAMLQAGTFPIDFNGINNAGFQQVGTPLNKANLLKDATAAQIGLPPSTTPDGMFQALGNTGELHVWRKTVTTAQEIPAGYKLESAKETLISTRAEYGSGTQRIIVEYASSCSVSESGDPYLVNSSSAILEATSSTAITSLNNLKGKFLKFSKDSSYQYVTVADGIFFIPSDATFRLEGGPYRIFVDKAQKVTGYAKIPAGTTTTYPVSTNPNAYQEGGDAKEAGYVVGEVVSGNFELAYSANYPRQFNVAESVTVDEAGNITLNSPVVYSFYTNSNGNSRDLIKGKFVTRTDNSPPWVKDGAIYYIPTDAVISYVSTWYEIDRYQPITGYAAIPAGTTIEYLGKLGDKARVQVVSYVGTGTYGEDNPCSITAGFKIKAAIMMYHYIPSSGSLFMIPNELSTNYTADIGFSEVNANYSWGKKSADGKTLSWYGTRSASGQFNDSGYKYYVLCIG